METFLGVTNLLVMSLLSKVTIFLTKITYSIGSTCVESTSTESVNIKGASIENIYIRTTYIWITFSGNIT